MFFLVNVWICLGILNGMIEVENGLVVFVMVVFYDNENNGVSFLVCLLVNWVCFFNCGIWWE